MGAQGATGTQGLTGSQGATGTQGLQGTQGGSGIVTVGNGLQYTSGTLSLQAVTGTGYTAVLANSPTLVTPNIGAATATSVNVGTLTYTPANALFTAQNSVNNYNQIIIQNSLQGTQASADLIVNNDKSTDSTYYGDFGINSSIFSGTGSLGLPNATYLYSSNGDLSLGTITSNAIHFVVNNGTTDALTISAAGAVTATSSVTASSHITSGGTSSQFVKGDGSLDSTAYVTLSPFLLGGM